MQIRSHRIYIYNRQFWQRESQFLKKHEDENLMESKQEILIILFLRFNFGWRNAIAAKRIRKVSVSFDKPRKSYNITRSPDYFVG